MEQIKADILRRAIAEAARQIIGEARSVTFNGRVYPNFGWCVIFVGSSASGKGAVLRKNLQIDGKVVNVDHFKKAYAKMRGIPYDSSDPESTNLIHAGVKNAGWKQKVTDNLLDPETHDARRLPNVIFDMTGRDPNNTVVDVAAQAKEAGYKVVLVWVIANRSETLLRNLQRPRRVPDRILHRTYNSLAAEMPPFLKGRYAGMYLDDAWFIFNSTEGIAQPDLTGEEAKHIAVRLDKAGESGFKFPVGVEQRLQRYLGRMEANPDRPETFLSSDEISSKYGTRRDDGSYRIDRQAVPDFYRR